MLHLIICEDDAYFRNKLEKLMADLPCTNYNITLSGTSTDDVIYYAKNNHTNSNIYILDIELEYGKNGILLAKEIRSYDPHGEIIFITSHPSMAVNTFKYRVRAFDFIEKSDSELEKRLFDDLQSILKNFNKKENTVKENSILIKSGNTTHFIELCKIVDFQMSGKNHKIRLTTIDNVIEFYGRLKEIEKQLDSRFYKSHRACIINTDHIKIINKNPFDMHILMINDHKSLLSRSGLKGLSHIV